MAGAIYSIKKNRFQRGYHPGFELEGEDGLAAVSGAAVHRLYLRAVDSGVSDALWGRLWFWMESCEDMVCYVYVAALDEDSFYRNGRPVRIEDFLCSEEEPDTVKKELLKRVEALRFVNKTDMLLYGLRGRYLYIAVEAIGAGRCRIAKMKVDQQGDNFLGTFPEVYRERGSFFHRYLSVFSSIYNDFQEDIDGLAKLLDLDSCPPKLLLVYAGWLGLDVGNDFLEEPTLRMLLKEAYSLNRMKGTKTVLERVAKIILGKDVLVLERGLMERRVDTEDFLELDRLYGKSIYDVTILVDGVLGETKKSQLMFFLKQFKPVRARLRIVFLKRGSGLDSYSYLDKNACISGQDVGILDSGQEIDWGYLRLG